MQVIELEIVSDRHIVDQRDVVGDREGEPSAPAASPESAAAAKTALRRCSLRSVRVRRAHILIS
jgi:hypothetical protein